MPFVVSIQLGLDEKLTSLLGGVVTALLQTQERMNQMEQRIMKAIDDFVAEVQTAFDAVSQAQDASLALINKVVADEQNLFNQIQQLKDQIANGASILAPEDQAKLNQVVSNFQTMLTRAQNTQVALQALDEAVPDLPAPPPTPPV